MSRRTLLQGPCRAAAALLPCLIVALLVSCSSVPADLKKAFSLAGDNSAELAKVLRHYADQDDPRKLDAAKFLIANMEGHGYTVASFYDKEKNEVAFDALDYANFGEAQAAFDLLEKEHGELDYRRKRFDADLETITADYLIENIDLAFKARCERPWAKKLSFEAFCNYVLPFRGSNEPLNSWRGTCMERFDDLPSKMKDPSDIKEAGGLINRTAHGWVGFDSLYYLHPTDQGFDEMMERRKGRCEDISNMVGYAMRANAVPSAADYTPFWANRDNNHAWEVILDENGRGRAGLSNRAAKIYRKMFAIQPGNLACIKRDDEEVPRWLSGKSYSDVTAQYMETADVTIRLEAELPDKARFAYICVFNGGDWRAIHWGAIDDGSVTFSDMGRNIAYLPAYFVNKELVPAAPPFILTKAGEVRPLRPDDAGGPGLAIEIVATTPKTPDADTLTERPMIRVKPGKAHELFVWKDGWESLGKKVAGDDPVAFESIPPGGLYWLVQDGSRRLERIFTIEKGKQVWW